MNCRKKVSVLIPCYNEEAGIGEVVKNFPMKKANQIGLDIEVIVIDNNSKDRTAEFAAAAGAKVISEKNKGKGNAMRRAFHSIPGDTDYVVMLDGDDTYRPEEVLRLIELLDSDFCDVVIGSRLGGRISEGSMNLTNRVGNWFFTFLIRVAYRVNVTDVLTGYFAWKRESIIRLRPHLVSSGFAIEMEMVTKMAKLGERIYSVPISYDKRAGHTNLRPIADGLHILYMFIKSLFWKPSQIAQVAEQESVMAA